MEVVKGSFDSHRCNVSITKRDNYYNKKSLKFRKKGICDIKKEIYYINKSNNYRKKTLCANNKEMLDISRKELDILKKRCMLFQVGYLLLLASLIQL